MSVGKFFKYGAIGGITGAVGAAVVASPLTLMAGFLAPVAVAVIAMAGAAAIGIPSAIIGAFRGNDDKAAGRAETVKIGRSAGVAADPDFYRNQGAGREYQDRVEQSRQARTTTR